MLLSPVLIDALVGVVGPSPTGVSVALAFPSGIIEALSSAPSNVLVVAAVGLVTRAGFS